ncbi:hypothetical protein E2562_019458 [Oryza meyeriana var. granulata]|uniref:Uncharacterized protein n=1 Tax=Oryza meyeriana var. granulata TaxID=110450 RepID=A0A6G1DJ75_9ORYZ|nr:hypothetical protein E2562_019458 [Oryza meyeriana var. granulata]
MIGLTKAAKRRRHQLACQSSSRRRHLSISGRMTAARRPVETQGGAEHGDVSGSGADWRVVPRRAESVERSAARRPGTMWAAPEERWEHAGLRPRKTSHRS